VAPAIAAAVLACTDAAAPLPQCSGAVTTLVSSGITPSFSWEPRCLAYGIVVYDSASLYGSTPTLPPLWNMLSTECNTIPPPVRYGVLPPDAVALGGPTALQAGTPYVVILLACDSPGSHNFGIGYFTP
jgi:hypothetical protein